MLKTANRLHNTAASKRAATVITVQPVLTLIKITGCFSVLLKSCLTTLTDAALAVSDTV